MQFDQLLSEFQNDINNFIIQANDHLVLLVNPSLNICYLNKCLNEIFSSPDDFIGKSIDDLLLPESRNIIPLPHKIFYKTLILNFHYQDSTPIPINCHIYKNQDQYHLILGVQIFATNDHFMQQMSKLNNELINMTRELSQKNILLENAKTKIDELLKSKELLLREVHHRIKNNMANIESLLALQMQTLSGKEGKDALESAKNRVHSMLIMYNKLYVSNDFNNMSFKLFIETMIHDIVNIYNFNNPIRLEIDIDDFLLNVKLLTPLGIIINELVTNAMKYAFANQENGFLFISAEKINDNVTVIIKDNGIGEQDKNWTTNLQSFGIGLVHMLTSQIHGNIDFEIKDGTKITLTFNSNYH